MANDQLTVRDTETERSIPIRVVDSANGMERTLVMPRFLRQVVLRVPVLELDVSHDDDTAVVTDDFSTVYGAGPDIDAAVADYLASLVDTFADLEAQEAVLAPGLREELAALRRYLVRTG